MPIATWRGTVLADSPETIIVEGNHYFPPDSVRDDLLRPSSTTSVCPWKGTARYYTIEVDGERNPDAAWTYPDTTAEAAHLAGRIAFWNGVEVTP